MRDVSPTPVSLWRRFQESLQALLATVRLHIALSASEQLPLRKRRVDPAAGGDSHSKGKGSGPLPLAVAWSGGPDSTALLQLTLDLSRRDPLVHRPLALHVVHEGFRCPKGLERDRAHLDRHARDVGVPLVVRTVTLRRPGNATPAGLESVARDARYRALAAMAREHSIPVILFGHTKEDQLETLLFRLHRGTGLRGLAGIPPVRRLAGKPSVWICRPLLGLSRAALLGWLVDAGIPFRDDPTNLVTRHARNRIRHHWIPALRLLGGEPLLGAIEASGLAAAGLREDLDREIEPLFAAPPGAGHPEQDEASGTDPPRSIRLDRDRMRGMRPRAVRAAIYDAAQRLGSAGGITRRHLERLATRILLPGSGKSFSLPGCILVRLERREVVLHRGSPPPAR